MQEINSVFYIIILILSVVIHEVSHGYAAYLLGDRTAKNAGRLTLNPIPHLDIFGSVILPLLLILTKVGFVIGWAKPVPYNPDNLTDKRYGELKVASAGILANLFVAIVFGIFIRVLMSVGYSPDTDPQIFYIPMVVVLLNIVLAIFNLVPIPPLDGSKILFSLLPYSLRSVQNFIERFGIFILIIFIIYFWNYLSPVIFMLYRLFTGTMILPI
jgi:Zn-dependent protease